MLPKNLSQQLEKRQKNDSLRQLSDKAYAIDFYSNDYLGYARSSKVTEIYNRLSENNHISKHGSTGSRLISGNHGLFKAVEDKAKILFNAEEALFYNSGYDANIGLLSAVLKPKDLVFYDELCHASIRDGLQMVNSKTYKYKHCDYSHLEQLVNRQIERLEYENIYVVTESVFSMDGDTTDIEKLVELKQNYNLHLIIDEAHALGVCGRDFKGLTVDYSTEIFARIITCGKSLGSHGAFVLGSAELKLFLVNFSRALMYSTGASPGHLQSVLASLTLFESETESKHELQSVIQYFKNQVLKLDLESKFLQSETAIQSFMCSGNTRVKTLAKSLNALGIGIKPILHPTVPKGEERLRICLHSYNTDKEVDLLLKTLSSVH